MTTRKEQINWLVDYYYENKPKPFGPDNGDLEDAFIVVHQELTRSQWQDRIRVAAKRLGLKKIRLPNNGRPFRIPGEPASFVVYV